jgi:acyl-CoA thioesterase FadM
MGWKYFFIAPGSSRQNLQRTIMARIDIEMTGKFVFETILEVRMADINTANHLGHDAFVSLMNEARVKFLAHLGVPMPGVEETGLIIADLAVSYKSQAFYQDRLRFEIGAGEFNKYGCDIFYRATNMKTGDLVGLAKTGIVFFDYSKNKVTNIPHSFVSHFV